MICLYERTCYKKQTIFLIKSFKTKSTGWNCSVKSGQLPCEVFIWRNPKNQCFLFIVSNQVIVWLVSYIGLLLRTKPSCQLLQPSCCIILMIFILAGSSRCSPMGLVRCPEPSASSWFPSQQLFLILSVKLKYIY